MTKMFMMTMMVMICLTDFEATAPTQAPAKTRARTQQRGSSTTSRVPQRLHAARSEHPAPKREPPPVLTISRRHRRNRAQRRLETAASHTVNSHAASSTPRHDPALLGAPAVATVPRLLVALETLRRPTPDAVLAS